MRFLNGKFAAKHPGNCPGICCKFFSSRRCAYISLPVFSSASGAAVITLKTETDSLEEAQKLLQELRVHQIEMEMQNEELRRAQAELSALQARYFELYDLAPVGYLTVSEKGFIREVNLAAASMLGFDRFSLVRQPLSRIFLKEDQDIYCLHLKQGHESSSPFAFEMRLVRADGSLFWARLHTVSAHDGEQWITLADISERRQAEDSLRKSEEQYRALVEHIPQRIIVKDRNSVYVSCNELFAREFGIKSTDIAGKTDYDLFPAELAAKYQSDDKRVMESGETEAFEEQYIQTGEKIWIYTIKTPFRDNEGNVSGIMVVFSDITERKRTAVATQTAALEWSACFDAMDDGVSIHSVDHSVLNANQAFLHLLGKSADEVIGKKCYQLFHEKECPAKECLICETRNTRQKASAEIFEPTLNKWLAISVSPVLDSAGGLLRVVHTVRDITEQRKLEMQYLHAQKMESVGTLAGGVAHDFNNILTAIMGYATLALMQLQESDPQRLYIQNILDASDRAATLTSELLLFSRKQPLSEHILDLNEAVTTVEKFLAKVIGEDIELKIVVHDTPLMVLADENRLEQVLMNLATNAGHAMPHGGALTVATTNITLDEEFVFAKGYGIPGRYALLTVTDSGTGMDEATQQRIFEPFFTTKGVGKGTGLGLAVVYGIIKQHNGFINVSSLPGCGTTFRIYLPLVVAGSMSVNPAAQQVPCGGVGETILLAEDNAMVRTLLTTVLTDAGYTVIEAVDGADAVNRFKENSAAIDMLLFDLIMPKMNGKEAFDEIRKLRPSIKAIFASGYTPDAIQQKVSLADGVHLITKPISPSNLLQRVRDVLG